MAARVGVVLSGCGVFDGSEIHEATSILIALDRLGAHALCMAPDITQATTTNHLTHQSESANRLVLVESARIARGKVQDLAVYHATDLDALVFPGGLGAAKNLSTFASESESCHVNPEVERLLLEMHKAGKPMGFACISPVIAARVFGKQGYKPTLTIGTDAATAAALKAMGATHQNTGPTDICIDRVNHLVSTPCYMNDVGPWTVFQGVEKMVAEVLKMIGK